MHRFLLFACAVAITSAVAFAIAPGFATAVDIGDDVAVALCSLHLILLLYRAMRLPLRLLVRVVVASVIGIDAAVV